MKVRGVLPKSPKPVRWYTVFREHRLGDPVPPDPPSPSRWCMEIHEGLYRVVSAQNLPTMTVLVRRHGRSSVVQVETVPQGNKAAYFNARSYAETRSILRQVGYFASYYSLPLVGTDRFRPLRIAYARDPVELRNELRGLPSGRTTTVAARRSYRLLEVVSLILPQRISLENVGDALEQIRRLERLDRPPWQVYIRLLASTAWIAIDTLRYWRSAMSGRLLPPK